MPNEKRLNLYKLKGWKYYAREGWKKIAEKYDTVEWGEGTIKPKSVKKDGNKTIIKF